LITASITFRHIRLTPRAQWLTRSEEPSVSKSLIGSQIFLGSWRVWKLRRRLNSKAGAQTCHHTDTNELQTYAALQSVRYACSLICSTEWRGRRAHASAPAAFIVFHAFRSLTGGPYGSETQIDHSCSDVHRRCGHAGIQRISGGAHRPRLLVVFHN